MGTHFYENVSDMDAFEVRRPAVVVLPTPPKISHHAPLPPPSARRIGTKKIDDDEDFAPTVKVRICDGSCSVPASGTYSSAELGKRYFSKDT